MPVRANSTKQHGFDTTVCQCSRTTSFLSTMSNIRIPFFLLLFKPGYNFQYIDHTDSFKKPTDLISSLSPEVLNLLGDRAGTGVTLKFLLVCLPALLHCHIPLTFFCSFPMQRAGHVAQSGRILSSLKALQTSRRTWASGRTVTRKRPSRMRRSRIWLTKTWGIS